MGIDALTHNDAGIHAAPASPETWEQWVSATRLRGYLLKNTLGDWLNLYGDANGFRRDEAFEGYDERLVFAPFIMERGNRFEEAVSRHLASFHELTTISHGQDDVRELEVAQQTFHALADGRPIIHQAVLWNPESRTYGAADFLIRSDVFDALFPKHLAPGEAAIAAPDLGGPWHYVVVDAKFTTVHLSKQGEVGNSGSSPAYKAQLYVYNDALARLQGYAPRRAFLLGRGWEQSPERGSNAMERLGPVPMGADVKGEVEGAAAWVRRLRSEGAQWHPLPTPTVPELWPSGVDWPWEKEGKRITDELEDLTKLWQVGPEKRNSAVRKGITSWKDPRATAETLGVTGPATKTVLEAILDVHRNDGPVVRPAHVQAAESEWREQPPLEFFVDFEYVSDLKDNFSTYPERGGQTIIFMIGCGHMEDGKWRFEQFTANRLDEPSEARAIDAWLAHMRKTQSRLGGDSDPHLFHWAPAEEINYETAYNSARKRHPAKGWPVVNWFDLLRKVVRKEPVVVKGSMGFGLKSVARAFHEHGLIKTDWGSSKVDGMGAMVGAWRCDDEAAERSVRLLDLPLMQEIAAYNEVDCKVMQEILHYLRAHH
ncbi:MAG: ribonuclease H-like domain-containing protein [Chloroflexi bacterium]|nr:ribonuclease H-like domain-containing protein [Chloroflexota bacterium]